MLLVLTYGVIGLLLARELATAIYNLYFHPLRSFAGPKLWIAFPVLRYVSQCRGDFDKIVVKFHEQYGPCVRFTHDSLSFATAQAWQDIYGYGHGNKQWPKLEFRPPGSAQHIVFSDDDHHAKFRKALNPAFSDQALRLQEPLMKQHIDTLINLLREESETGKPVDMTMWYSMTAPVLGSCLLFLVSDLAFGESPGCLKSRAYTPYISTIFNFLRVLPFLMLARFHPLLWKAISPLIRGPATRARLKMGEMGQSTLDRRRADSSKDGRGDFMEALLRYSESKSPIPDDQLAGNAMMLFMAGSETTATTLAGVTWYMLKNPETLKKATDEIRSTFKTEHDITFRSASTKLPYTLACLEEGLRLYPASPSALLRTVLDTSTISGYVVPAGTHVGVHQMSTNRSPANFYKPHDFIPERWLPESTKDASSPFFKDDREARQPFLVGPRNCIGKSLAISEMRQILVRILWNFDLELVDENEVWTDQRIFILWHKKPLMCRITTREH